MSKSKSRQRHGTVTRKLITICLLSMAGWVVFVFLFLAAATILLKTLFRYTGLYDTVYELLSPIASHLDKLIPAVILAGWAVIFCLIIMRCIRYLDELTGEAKKLADPDGGQIHLSDELKSVQDELNAARELSLKNAAAAKEAKQKKDDLVIYLAHDLKTPLTSVIGYLSLLSEEKELSDAAREKYTGIALDKARRLETLINEFFEITRFNLTDMPMHRRNADLSLMLMQLVSEFQPLLREKHLSCTLSADEKVTVDCDPDAISRVFDNLLKNAVNYSFEGTTIAISLTAADGFATVRFENSGHTLPPEKLDRIFEQFYRLDSARSSASGGAGLGLAIAKQIVMMHGGSIFAQSENGNTVFTVKFETA